MPLCTACQQSTSICSCCPRRWCNRCDSHIDACVCANRRQMPPRQRRPRGPAENLHTGIFANPTLVPYGSLEDALRDIEQGPVELRGPAAPPPVPYPLPPRPASVPGAVLHASIDQVRLHCVRCGSQFELGRAELGSVVTFKCSHCRTVMEIRRDLAPVPKALSAGQTFDPSKEEPVDVATARFSLLELDETVKKPAEEEETLPWPLEID